MAQAGTPSAQPMGGGQQRTVPPPLANEHSQQKRDLASWWKNFKRSDKKVPDQQQAPQGIFGIPLQTSIRYANVAISLLNDEGQSYIYGYVPIVVAKCGVFLKEKATDVEGIFRLAGSEKRIKELKVAFDSPDRYGKGLDWTGYTVHDAANILRRYFNLLPEPIIPLDFYEHFRNPLRNHQADAVGPLDTQSPSVGHFDQDAAIRRYQALITELPPLNRQLLLYILDLLAVFASKSDLNKMTTQNLAAIFQPGILSHPQHDMAPPEYRLSQDVLIFLIENQDSFLIGMQGTAVDQETVRDVQSGPHTPPKAPATPTTPGRSKTIIGRSSSNASAGADSVRKFGGIRRNVSVSSSKRSQRSEAGTPVTAAFNSPGTPTSGVHRSNTVPSRRGGSNASPRFSRDKHSDPSTPSPAGTPAVPVDANKARQESLQSTPVATKAPELLASSNVASGSSSEVTTPLAAVGSDTSSAVTRDYQTPKKDTTPLLAPPGGSAEQNADRSPSQTPSAPARGFLDIFKQSPTSDSEARKPNKLQKKRIPGSSLSSAQSSTQDLGHDGQEDSTMRSPISPSSPSGRIIDTPNEKHGEDATIGGLAALQTSTPQRATTEATLKPTASPAHSIHSTTDMSDADMVGDDMPKDQLSQPDRERKRHRWRFSRSQNKLDPASPPTGNPLGTMTAQEQTTSRSTVGSSTGGQPRRSFQEPTPLSPAATEPGLGEPMRNAQIQSSNTDPVFSDSEKERKSGPMSWIRGKIQEHKGKEAEKRTRTPDRSREPRESRQDLPLPNEGLPVRGKSFEQSRPSASSGSPAAAPAETNAFLAATQAAANNPTAVSPAPTTGTEKYFDAPARPSASSAVPIPTNGTESKNEEEQAASAEGATAGEPAIPK